MICEDDPQTWIPADLWYQFQRQKIVERDDWSLNYDTIVSNIRWCPKPNDEVLLVRKENQVLRWNRNTKQYRLYSVDKKGKETYKDHGYSLYRLGKPHVYRRPRTSYLAGTTLSSHCYNTAYNNQITDYRNKQIVQFAKTVHQANQRNTMA